MNYTLKREDKDIAYFFIYEKFVESCTILKNSIPFLPLPLKRLVKDGYKDEFIDHETDEYYTLNEDGCDLFDNWISEREIPVNRYNYASYIEKGSSPREWLLKNNGYSFNDNYWFESEYKTVTWKDILQRLHSLDSAYSVKDENHQYKGHNSTLGGQLEKFWYQKDGQVMLCKKIDKQYDILIAREIVASLIYERQLYPNFCKYEFVYDQYHEIVGCNCKAFTNEHLELITAYDLLEEHNMTQVDNVWNKIIDLACNYGLDTKQTSDYLDIQALIDYLITNRDRHQNNIGFLRDAEALKLVSPAPIFDSGSSKHKEGEYPETYLNTTVNGLYPTELECLQHVSNFDVLDLSKLPTRDEIDAILNECSGLTESRKNKLLDIYDQKKDFLFELQQQYRLGTDIKEYLENYKNTSQNHLESETEWLDL